MSTGTPSVRSLGGRAALLAAVLLVALASGTGETGAAFSSVTANAGSSFSAAAATCTATTPQTVTANRDAWIRSDDVGDNEGTRSELEVRSQIGEDRRSLVSFALPTAPAGCTLLSAKLRLYATSAITPRTILAAQLAGTWTETGVTWGTQPATTGTAATAPSGIGWVEFTTTAIVQSQYATTNHGFLIRDSAEGGTAHPQSYSSREGSHPPQLVLTFG
jgi:hypothetical protein